MDATTSAARPLTVGADEVVVRVPSEATAGALLAVDVRMPPGGGPPVLHRHAAAEVYRVEGGEFTLYVEDAAGGLARVVAGPGSVVPIPGGRAHTVRNEGRAEARAHVVFAPGGDIERFLLAAADAGGDPASVAVLAARHGIEMTRPLPG
jgi:oxalate decarboxylase/phosphoglucose isomerase-like protein (cupin superfamily)